MCCTRQYKHIDLATVDMSPLNQSFGAWIPQPPLLEFSTDTYPFVQVTGCKSLDDWLPVGKIYSYPMFISVAVTSKTLQCRHYGRDSVSNHQPHYCLLNRLFRRRSKKTSKLRVTGLCAENSPVPGEFPAKMASYAENVSIWLRHHEMHKYQDRISNNGSLTIFLLDKICIGSVSLFFMVITMLIKLHLPWRLNHLDAKSSVGTLMLIIRPCIYTWPWFEGLFYTMKQ